MAKKEIKISVLICSFNRKEKTIQCLSNLSGQILPRNVKLQITLLDDNSVDGTPEEVREHFPDVKLVKGTGSMFWARGMRAAYEGSLAADFYFWLNDDTFLYPDSIQSMLECYHQQDEVAIISGAVADPKSRETTYGGLSRVKSSFIRFRMINPGPGIKECDAANGNSVLIPAEVYQKIGNIDPFYIHAHADIDFFMRARKAGFKIFLCDKHIGECCGNFLDERVFGQKSLTGRMKSVCSKKGFYPPDWFYFCMKHLKFPSNFYSFLYPYTRVLIQRKIFFVRRSPVLTNGEYLARSLNKMIRFVYFDVAGVLLDFDWNIFFSKMTKSYGIRQSDLDEIIFKNGLYEQFDSGIIDANGFMETVREKLSVQFDNEVFKKHFASIFSMNEKNFKVAGEISKYLPVGIISNTNEIHAAVNYRKFEEQFGIFKVRLLSFQEKKAKPDKEFFRKAIERSGTKAAHILFIDDDPKNIKVAKEMGMHTIYAEQGRPIELRQLGL